MVASLRFMFSVMVLSNILLTTPGAAAEPTPIEAAQLLKKLSLRLKHSLPSREETQAFQRALREYPDQFDKIYDERIEAYLSGSEFSDVVESFHSIWWRLLPAESTRLARYIVAEDRPYSEVFQHNYLVINGQNAPRYQRQGIATDGALPSGSDDWRVLRLKDDETRFRSVLGSLDFLDTYPDTPTNRNRKRANYVFSTFLCESLAPSDPDSKATLRDDPHGSNPNCIGCHYRLDPLARFFDRWRPPSASSVLTWYDEGEAAKGKLIVKPAEGGRFDYEGTGEGELSQILSKEPRVHACVAKKVWETFVGSAIKLDNSSAMELTKAFKTRDNFKDLVRAAVHHPYFWSNERPPALTFNDVKASFKICSTCHSSQGSTFPRFDPAAYPFATVASENAQLLRDIYAAITHQPDYSPMPKSPAPGVPAQALSVEQLSAIREWIYNGALDSAGRPTLSETEKQEVLHDD